MKTFSSDAIIDLFDYGKAFEWLLFAHELNGTSFKWLIILREFKWLWFNYLWLRFRFYINVLVINISLFKKY